MDTKEFIEKFAEALEIENTASLTADTEFRKLTEWDSLAVLNIVVLLDEEYDIQIENKDFKNFNTLQDIVTFIENNK